MARLGNRRAGFATAAALAALCALPAGAAAMESSGPLSPALAQLAKPPVRALPGPARARAMGVAATGPGALIREGNRVLVDVRFHSGALARLAALRGAGAAVVTASGELQRATVAVPPADLDSLAAVPGVAAVTQVRAPVLRTVDPCKGGSVISEGVAQLNVEAAREEFEVEGKGLTVGVLSDSFNQATEAVPGGPIATKASDDIISKDLPGVENSCEGQAVPVHQLQSYAFEPGFEPPFDEGRGMLQIVHDVAPRSRLAFSSAFNGEEAFAEGIEQLATPTASGGGGARVIVDDVGYFEEPFFQQGPVADAVDEVSEHGVTYLSAAGNDNLLDSEGNDIGSWEAPEYRDSGSCPREIRERAGTRGTHCLDFDPGGPVDRTFGLRVEPEETLTIDLQWAEPWFGVGDDLDAFLLDSEGKLLTTAAEDNLETQKPVEILQWENDSSEERTVQLAINRFAGSADPRLKFILLEDGEGVSGTEYPTSGGGDVVGPTIYGHAASPAAVAVGAISYAASAEPEEYSSRGPVTNYFAPVEGTTPAAALIEPEVISKPDVTATDCGRTTFFARQPKSEPGIWRFCGTSAAAPHAAGVAALALSLSPKPSSEEIKSALAETGTAIGSFGSCAVGGGLVESLAALELLEGSGGGEAPEACAPPDAGGPVVRAAGDWGREDPPGPPPVEPVTPAVPTPNPPVVPITPPAAPRTSFAKSPAKVVKTHGTKAKVTFRFRADQSGASFSCKFDAAAFKPCAAKVTRWFGLGGHTVKVRAATASAGNGAAASFKFRVKRVG